VTNQDTRKESSPIKVYCLPQEKTCIAGNANDCGLTVSAYLRTLGQGYQPASIIDNKKVAGLIQVNADLGRLGGLLKLWLSNDRKAAHFNKENIIEVLQDIQANQKEIRLIINHIIKS